MALFFCMYKPICLLVLGYKGIQKPLLERAKADWRLPHQ